MIPHAPVKFFEFFDVISLSLPVLILSWILLTYRKQNRSFLATVSHTLAANRKSNLVFSTVMTIFYPLYYVFLWLWVGPHANVMGLFYGVLVVGALSEMVLVWVSISPGRRGKIHTLAASIVGVAMFILGAIILMSGQQVSYAGSMAIEVFLVISLLLAGLWSAKPFRMHIFAYESIYSLAFIAAISIVAHT